MELMIKIIQKAKKEANLKPYQIVDVFVTIFNTELNEYYKILGIIKEIKGEYMNFEITWLYQKIFFPNNMDTIISDFKNSKKKFLIIPLGIHQDNGAHANILLYDSELNELERFEPSGASYPKEFNYNPELLDHYIKEFFIKYFPNLKYFLQRHNITLRNFDIEVATLQFEEEISDKSDQEVDNERAKKLKFKTVFVNISNAVF
jgi:hypothetical protein